MMKKLYFDGTCGICSRTIKQLEKNQLLVNVNLIPIRNQQEFLKMKIDLKINSDSFNEMYFVSNQDIFAGYFAFKKIFQQSKSIYRVIFLIPFADFFGPKMYKIFSRNRKLFSKQHSCGIF